MSNLYSVTPTRADCQRAVRRAWLLDLEWAGRVYRLSTEPVVMTDDRGIVRQYVGGLLTAPSLTIQSNRSGADDAAPSAGLSLSLDDTDVASRVAAGARLQEARGNLYAVFIDEHGAVIQPWSRRIAYIIDGRCSEPGFDGPNDPTTLVRITLTGQPAEDSTTLLDPLAVIDGKTWPEVGDDAEQQGKVYPIVFGQPGLFTKADGTGGSTSGSPAYPVTFTANNADYLLICGADVDAATVTVYDDSGSNDVFTVILTQDGRGRFVSVVNISGGGIARDSAVYWVKWSTGGGIRNPYGSGALERLGDVVRWVLGFSSAPVNLSAFANEDELNRLQVAGFFNDNEATPYESAIDLISLHPGAGIRRDANGIRPVVRRLDYSDDETAGTITAYTINPIVGRAPSPDFVPLEGEGWRYTQAEGDVITDAALSFARRTKTGRYRRQIRCTHDPEPGAAEEFATEYAVMAETRQAAQSFRKPRSRRSTVEVDALYDEASAGYVVAETVRQSGFDSRERAYYCSFEWGWLDVNEVYMYADDALTTAVQVEVTSKEPNPWGYTVTLTLDDDPVRLGPKAV